MLRVGDLVEHTGVRCYVQKIDRATDTAFLHGASGLLCTVGAELDETEPGACKVVCNPATDWPHITLDARKFWRISNIVRMVGSRETFLREFHDWVKPDKRQQGGALFFNPALRLGFGHVLTAHFEDSPKIARLSIPRGFGTTGQRVARQQAAIAPPKRERTAYDHLLDSDDFED